MTPQPVSLPARLHGHAVSPGRPWPMGASLTGDGVNFAVFSAHAERIELCLFTPDGRKEMARLDISASMVRKKFCAGLEISGLVPEAVRGRMLADPHLFKDCWNSLP